MKSLTSRIERLEQLMSDKDDTGTVADYLREMMPGAEAFEAELAAVGLDAAWAVANRLGIKRLADANPHDREIVDKAIELAVKDHATRLLRGDRTPPPEYGNAGLNRPVDLEALDRLIERAKALSLKRTA